MPDNDLDKFGGDPRRIAKIRTRKMVAPWLFDPVGTLVYAWSFEPVESAETHARAICSIAQRLYQLGRGVDMAWASAEILHGDEFEFWLASHEGPVFRPVPRAVGAMLSCPQAGSMESIETRYAANRRRFGSASVGKQSVFSQPPKPRFRSIAYNSAPRRFLFELRETAADAPFISWSETAVVRLVEVLRDAASERLKIALPKQLSLIEQVVIGRNALGAQRLPRARIIPLPSIGQFHADRGIRRVIVEVPSNCSIPAEDIAWAFSGLEFGADSILSIADDDRMLSHYGINDSAAAHSGPWRTVTPVALPGAWNARADRAPSGHAFDGFETEGGPVRVRKERFLAYAVIQALRHAYVFASVAAIRVQREPFDSGGSRAEEFASATRFVKARLWHMELTFTDPVSGPLVIGDGRYLGLGLLAPLKKSNHVRLQYGNAAEASAGCYNTVTRPTVSL